MRQCEASVAVLHTTSKVSSESEIHKHASKIPQGTLHSL